MRIEVQNLTCRYAKEPVLEDVSVTLDTHTVIVGPNGAGKSTLALAVCGVLPYTGTIHFDGTPPDAKRIAYIPSTLEVYDPYISVARFVLMGRYAHKRTWQGYDPHDEARVTKVLAQLRITHLATLGVKQLSLGQQQLVLIAQALVQAPQVLVFDEPTAHLDPKNSRFFVQLLAQLQKQHRIILITHDLSVALHVGYEVMFVDSAKVQMFNPETFFLPHTLNALYGTSFWREGDHIGVHYA